MENFYLASLFAIMSKLKKWTRPSDSTPKPTSDDPLAKYLKLRRADPSYKDPSRKEAVLLNALSIAQFEEDNADAISEIIDNALEFDLIQLAFEAFRSFSSSAEREVFHAASQLFDLKYWPFITEEFFSDCEAKVLRANDKDAGRGFYSDYRSQCLGQMGVFQHYQGSKARAYDLWESASDGAVIDEVIARSAEKITESPPNKIQDIPLSLVETICSPKIKAKAIASLCKYID